jgi:hypothetical protein
VSELEQVRESLRRLDELLANFEVAPDVGTPQWFDYESLVGQQLRLLQRQELLEGDFQVEVRLLGRPVVGTRVEVPFLTDFLGGLQDAVLSITQMLTGQARDRAPFQRDVLAAGRLHLVATPAGSFILGMQGPAREPQLPFEGAAGTPFDEAVDLVMDVMKASEDDVASDALLEAASQVGGRGLKHLERLAGNISSSGAQTVFVHRNPLDEEQPLREVSFGTAAARRLQSLLSATESSVETIEVEGRLVGVSWIRKRFELEAGEGAAELTVYRGTVSVDLRNRVADAFDQHVRATLERTQVVSSIEGAGEKVSYHLIGVS